MRFLQQEKVDDRDPQTFHQQKDKQYSAFSSHSASSINKAPTTYFSLIQKVNSNGLYQRNIFVIFTIGWFVVALTTIQTVFLFKNAKYNCEGKGFLTASGRTCSKAICELPEGQREQFLNNKQKGNESQESQSQSLVLQFGPYLCEQLYVVNLMKSSESLGALIGLFGFMYFSDNYGRKLSLSVIWLTVTLGIGVVVSAQSIQMACVGLFVIGLGIKPFLRITLTVFAQIVSLKQRQKYSSLINLSYGGAGIIVAGVYYWIEEWRVINGFFILLPALGVLGCCVFYLEETPRYLLLEGQRRRRKRGGCLGLISDEEICRRLNRIWRINYGTGGKKSSMITVGEENMEEKFCNDGDGEFVVSNKANFSVIIPDDITCVRKYEQSQLLQQTRKQNSNQRQRYNILTLFKYPSLRRITPLVMFIQLIISYLYISPALVVDKWGFDPYTSMVIVSCSELVAYPLSGWLIDRSPRVNTGLICLGVNGLISFVLVLRPKPQSGCGQNGNGCFEAYMEIVGIFVQRMLLSFYYAIYVIFENELFPNCVRAIGTGLAAAVASFSGILGNPVIGYFYDNHLNPQVLNIIIVGLALVMLVFLPETLNQKGENEEIKELLREGKQEENDKDESEKEKESLLTNE